MIESIESPAARATVVSGSFDDVRSPDVRFLEECARSGPVHIRLWSDDLVASLRGARPAFPAAERRFMLASLRYVAGVSVISRVESVGLPLGHETTRRVLHRRSDDNAAVRAACEAMGVEYRVADPVAGGFGEATSPRLDPAARRVVVTGCYDWLHSGHVEFFREAARHGELYVVVGSDRNVRLLKGEGHPMHGQDERRYMVGAVRFVHRALVSTGTGWMDAEPEIATIRPHVYVVNEDGDQPEKREFCQANGLEYLVLRRRPHRGLPRRTSTDLRGF